MIVWDAERVESGLAAVSPLSRPLLQHVGSLLDSYHGESRSPEYYDVLLGNWVDQFLHLVYFAFTELTESPSVVPQGQDMEIQVEPDPLSFILSTVDHPKLTRSLRDAVHLIMNGGRLSNIRLIESPASPARQSTKTRMRSALLNMASPRKPDVLLCSPYLKNDRRDRIATLLRWRNRVRWDELDDPVHWEAECDLRWRISQATDHQTSSDVLDIAKTLVSLFIPKLYLEGYSNYRRQVLAADMPRPKAVYSANALNWNARFKTLAAEWREHGTRLLYHQHGGGYGIDQQNVAEDYEVRVSDRYYTWGWRHSSPNVLPLAPAFPAIIRAGRNEAKWAVLLVCLETSRIPYRLWYQPMPGTMELVISETADFVASLGDPRGLMVRLAPKNFGWGMREAIAHRTPGTRFDDFAAGAFERFSESRVVVHNYLGTSWLETLASNVPTVCFYSPKIQAFRNEAIPFIRDLERIGVLHRSGRDAATFVRALGNAVEAWWDSEDVQASRRAFVAQYANFSRNWAVLWEAEFDSLH